MFTCANPNIIVSDEGFSVQVLGRTGLRYQQDQYSLHINSEVLAGPHGLVVYTSSIRKWNEPNGLPITKEAKSKIVDNIRRAFGFRNIEVEII